MGLHGVIVSSWAISVHLIFNHLNTRNDYHLIRAWMKISYELPAATDRDYQVVGLSREKNKNFWLAEDAFNARYNRIMNVSLLVSCVVFSMQLFFVR